MVSISAARLSFLDSLTGWIGLSEVMKKMFCLGSIPSAAEAAVQQGICGTAEQAAEKLTVLKTELFERRFEA